MIPIVRRNRYFSVIELVSALHLGAREHVAITGGGGKTSLMFAIAEGLCAMGRRVVTSTTTRVRYGEAQRAPEVVLVSSKNNPKLVPIREGLDRFGHVFAGQKLVSSKSSKKVSGISVEVADQLYRVPWLDYLILEADGAAGHPVKAPAPHEPVIPSTTTLVIAVLGLEALGQKLLSKFVFRPAIFKKLTGLEYGRVLEPHILAGLFKFPEGLFKAAPISSRRIALLNKTDLLDDTAAAAELAESILDDPSGAVKTVLMGSVREASFEMFRKG